MALFSVAEARAFDKLQLSDAARVSDAAITAAAADIEAEFADIVGTALATTTAAAELHDGDGTARLVLDHVNVQSITALSVDGTAFTVAERADLAVYPNGTVIRKTMGTFAQGYRNVSVTYTHGLTTVPSDLKRAALILATRRLIPTNVAWEATSGGDGMIDWSRQVAPERGRWYGIDVVDGVLRRCQSKYTIPVIA